MIPKIVHIAWVDKNLLSSNHPLILNGIKNFNILNPDWSITISDDDDINYYLKNNLLKQHFNLVSNIGIVAKTDIWRLLKIYLEGGLYVDIDRLCNKSISNLFDNNTKWILPTCRDHDFSHDIMLSDKSNPVFKCVIDLYLKRREMGINNTYFLGAMTYMHGIILYLTNQIINVNPGVEVINSVRENLNQYSFIKTIRETPPQDTFLYNGYINVEMLETFKRSFYKENKIKHWTGDW